MGAAASYINVYYTNAAGLVTLVPPAQYTLSLNLPAVGQIWGIGGTVVYPISGAPIANGTSITIARVIPLQQLVSIANQGPFSPQVIEQMGDILEMQSQQINARTGQFRGTWLTATFYNYADIVQDGVNGANSGNYYMCVIPNTSGTWSTDLAAGDWVLALQATLPTASLPLAVANGGTGDSTLTQHAVLIGEGSSSVSGVLGGAATVLIGNAGADPSFSSNPTIQSLIMRGASSGSTTVQAQSVASGTLSLPAATDTLVGRTTTDTLTNKTLNQPNIVGVTTNSSAPTGSIGQTVSSTVTSGSPVSLSNGTPATLTSIPLTAGSWFVWNTANIQGGTATQAVYLQSSISSTAATIDTTPGRYGCSYFGSGFSTFNGGTSAITTSAGLAIIRLAGTATIYSTVQSGFSLGNVTAFGIITAERFF